MMARDRAERADLKRPDSRTGRPTPDPVPGVVQRDAGVLGGWPPGLVSVPRGERIVTEVKRKKED